LPGAGIQEPQELLQLGENQAFGQWEFWSLLAGCGLQKGSAV
jgi:hypothetical protein